MKKILITGGPVHAYLDSVKIITNRFKGGLMCRLAENLADLGAEVFYVGSELTSEVVPKEHPRIHVLLHRGFDNYMSLVCGMAPNVDGVILGAAVANVICANPIEGKFPSHNYKPGDKTPFELIVAQRVIEEVKKVASKTQLFGCKYLDSNASHDELIRAAYEIVLDAKATAVIANQGRGEQVLQKYVVTKERGVHPMKQADLAGWIWEMLQDEYYSTERIPQSGFSVNVAKIGELLRRYASKFLHVETGLIFGTVAVREDGEGFYTTGRGKRELDSFTFVERVDHQKRLVYSWADIKASLNAPLLAKIFANPDVDHIVHYHEQVANLPTYPYAPPGTVRDTNRPNHTSFNIAEHGCMLLFDKKGRMI